MIQNARNFGPLPQINEYTKIMGVHDIVEYAFNGKDLGPIFAEAQKRVAQNPALGAAYIDISMILQSHGRTDEALDILDTAFEYGRDYCVVHGEGTGPHILAFVIPGDFMANTPLDFLLQGSNAVLWLRYVDENITELENLPDHDIAFMAIGESLRAQETLKTLGPLLQNHPKPVLNADTEFVRGLTRDGVGELLKGAKHLICPMNYRTNGLELASAINSPLGLKAIAEELRFPIIVRPTDSHAGEGMEKIENEEELIDAIKEFGVTPLLIAPFIDYRSPDGKFHKQRIVFIGNKPFASHLAISSYWKVHYMNAQMAGSDVNRAIEQTFMESFDEDFARRFKPAFDELCNLVGLDYFGIDCAIAPDGRLLIFEMDVAMIVHDLDSEETYPYKKPAMRKLFTAFSEFIENRILRYQLEHEDSY